MRAAACFCAPAPAAGAPLGRGRGHVARVQRRARPSACAAPQRAVQVRFTPEDTTVDARVGECVADVAERARVDVLVNCNVGDCGSCEIERVLESGERRIVRACIAPVPEPEDEAGDTVTYLTYPDNIW